jgi:tRNA (cytidine/uridine-2'-O-)-methyltransferase
MFHIILHEPQIPPNTGNVIRLCANTGARLHLVRPLGFALDEKHLRRAGLDYRELAEVEIHADFAACLARLGAVRLFAVESGSPTRYCDVRFEPGDALVFGCETRGLPRPLLDALPAQRQLALPMLAGNRSLNLSNAVAAVTYEAWRQNGFAEAAIPRGRPGS